MMMGEKCLPRKNMKNIRRKSYLRQVYKIVSALILIPFSLTCVRVSNHEGVQI